jgi:serine/threonine-protein kinase
MTQPGKPSAIAALRDSGFGVGRLLGSGGACAVYEVTQQGNPPGAPALALKLLHAEHAGNLELVLRFFNEEHAAARVRHPGVVRVFSGGLIAGQAYLILERLDGTLAQRAPGLSRKQRVAVVAQVAAAAAALHRAGVVHRDLKPGNIMFAPGAELAAKIIDLGLAKLTGRAEFLPVSTATTEVLGTAEYRAPELWISAKDADGRADVYALGVMLYELLAGSVPFRAERESVLMDLHLYAPPPPLSNLAPRLGALLMRMLAKARSQRPDMDAVAEALGGIPAGDSSLLKRRPSL